MRRLCVGVWEGVGVDAASSGLLMLPRLWSCGARHFAGHPKHFSQPRRNNYATPDLSRSMPAEAPTDNEVLINQLALSNAQQLSSVKALAAQFAYSSSDNEDSDNANDDAAEAPLILPAS
jgi:hypothetical protein